MVVMSVAAIGIGGTAGPALAAAPSNDTRGGALAISSLPFDATVTTSQATTDADDTALNNQCGAPVTNGSVWYTFTPAAGVSGILVDVSGSDYSSGVIIAEPDGLGGLVVDTCGPGVAGTFVNPGTTYTILAFSDTPGVTGGTLRLHAEQAVVPTVSATVNPKGKVDKYGNALITGTYTCTGGNFIDLDTFLSQPVGRFAVQGEGFTGGGEPCDGVKHAWSTVVTPFGGAKFAGGKAAAFTFAFSCGSVFCANTFVQQTVRLSK